LKFDKNDIINRVSRIRDEIGHENIKPQIKDIIFNEEDEELLIITSDSPEKSLIIGKGGWVVGKLKEELNVKKIHVEAYSDILLRKYRMSLAYTKMDEIIGYQKNVKLEEPLKNLFNFLKKRINYHYGLNVLLKNLLNTNLDESSNSCFSKPLAVVALSGGVDSSFSLIVAKIMGFKPLAVTVNPGDIILPKYFRDNVENLSKKLNVNHKYLEVDISQVVEGALEGRYHPCGRCSKLIENNIIDYAQKSGISIMIFGDLLATGSQSMNFKEDILRINLPALLSATKGETKDLAGIFGVTSTGSYGCPLLSEVHKKYGYMRRFSIQRVLRETRAGVLESGEALDMIVKLCSN
jgi:predicted PP-loop superfamily ATPase